jgi:hypothetical protein
MSGFAKIPNAVIDEFAATDPLVIALYAYLVRNAAYERRSSPHGYTLEKGECDLTMSQVAKALNVTKGWIQKRYNKLSNINTITIRRATPKRNVITLMPCGLEADSDTIPIRSGYEPDTNGIRSGYETPPLSKKKSKTKTKTKKKEDGMSADADVAEDFESLWKLWPPNERKSGKANCLKKFKSLSAGDREACAAGWREYCAIMTPLPAKHFMPMPATWLNQRRWLDDRETWRTQRASWGGAAKDGAAFGGVDISDPDSYDPENWK